MHTVLEIGMTNAVLVVILALPILAITRLWRNPYAARFLWLLLLIKFIIPPMVEIPFPNPGATEILSNLTEISHGSSIPLPFDLELPQTSHSVDHGITDSTENLTTLRQPLNKKPSVNSRVTLPVIVMTVWISGSLLWLIVSIYRIARFDRIVRRGPVVDESLQLHINSLAHSLGLSRSPQGRIIEASIAPLIWFTRSQSILILPAGLLKNLSEQQTATVLAHELSHLKRHDHLVRWFELGVIIIFWWHPVVWWTVSRLHEAQEECCDASVLHIFPEKKQLYGETLFQVAEFLSRQSSPPATALSLGNTHQLKRRLTMILENRPPLQFSILKRIALLLLAVVVLPLSARAFPNKVATPKTKAAGTQLRWKLKTGETLRYSLKVEYDSTTTVETSPEKPDNKPGQVDTTSQQIDMEWKVTEIRPDGMIAVSMRIPRFRLKRRSPHRNQSIEYDSRNNETDDEVLHTVSRAVTKFEFQFLMDSHGKIKKMTLPEKLLGVLKNQKVLRDKPYSFFVGFQAEFLEEALNSVLLGLPKTAVSKGDEWTRNEQRPLGNNMVASNIRYRYNGSSKENLQQIDLNTKVNVSPLFDGEPDIHQNLVFEKGANKGSVLFDSKSGRIRKSRYYQTFSMIHKIQNTSPSLSELSKEDAETMRKARIVQTLITKTTLSHMPEIQ